MLAAQALLEEGKTRVSVLPVEELPDPILPEAALRQLQRQGMRVTAYLDAPRKRSHGRFERREIWALHWPQLNAYLGTTGDAGEVWPFVQQVCWIKRERFTAKGSSVEISYAITSLNPDEADAERINLELRGYWGAVENGSHCVRDTTLQEDASQVRTGGGTTGDGCPAQLDACLGATCRSTQHRGGSPHVRRSVQAGSHHRADRRAAPRPLNEMTL